ncbi:MAG: hypothetical protein ACRER9_00615 [Gammaproteobacteria bacterium]
MTPDRYLRTPELMGVLCAAVPVAVGREGLVVFNAGTSTATIKGLAVL